MGSRTNATVIGLSCLLLVPAPALAAGLSCDRACLRTTLDQYLAAIVKHDPAAAPLSVAFRQTDNAVVVRPGTGTWMTVGGLGKVQRRYVDTVTGQVAYFGIIEETAGPAIATLRLKVDDRKITEAEWIIARKDEWGPNGPGGNLMNPDSLMANPPMERTVPKERRLSRDTMVAVANSYFDGLTTHDGNIIQHEPGCTRIENGTVMTGRARGNAPAGDCASNLEGLNVSIVAARRYPIVDEEAGVVLGMGVFLRKPGTTTRRNCLTEWFFVDNNRIKTIYAAMFYPPADQPVPNWPPYDGNWPLPPPAAAPAK